MKHCTVLSISCECYVLEVMKRIQNFSLACIFKEQSMEESMEEGCDNNCNYDEKHNAAEKGIETSKYFAAIGLQSRYRPHA